MSTPRSDSADSPGCRDEQVRMSIAVEGAAAAQELLQCLSQASSDVSFSVDCIAESGAQPCVITVDHLSKKQLEVIDLAVEEGYYEDPRETSLSDLAEILDISPSAVSQRLNTVEHKLIRSLAESCR